MVLVTKLCKASSRDTPHTPNIAWGISLTTEAYPSPEQCRQNCHRVAFDDTHSGPHTQRAPVGPEPTEGLPPTGALGPVPIGALGSAPTLLVNIGKKSKTTTNG